MHKYHGELTHHELVHHDKYTYLDENKCLCDVSYIGPHSTWWIVRKLCELRIVTYKCNERS